MVTTAERLRRGVKRAKVEGSKPGAKGVPREAEEIANPDDPRGQFAAFLREWVANEVDARNDRRKKDAPVVTKKAVLQSLADAIGIQLRGVQKWTKGASGPNLGDMDTIAKEMGFRAWDELAVAIVAFSRKHRRK